MPTVVLQTTEIDVDDSDNQSDPRVISFSATYNQNLKGLEVIPSSLTPSYVVLSFGAITSSSFIRIQSDTPLLAKFNSGSQEFTIESTFICTGAFTAISIKNVTANDATVSYEVYGVYP